jgi:hypothetical protein
MFEDAPTDRHSIAGEKLKMELKFPQGRTGETGGEPGRGGMLIRLTENS